MSKMAEKSSTEFMRLIAIKLVIIVNTVMLTYTTVSWSIYIHKCVLRHQQLRTGELCSTAQMALLTAASAFILDRRQQEFSSVVLSTPFELYQFSNLVFVIIFLYMSQCSKLM